MKVCVLGRGVPTTRYPQNGIFEFDQAKALHNRGVNIVYLAIDARSVRKKRRWGLVHYDGMAAFPVYSLNIPLGPIPFGISINVCRVILGLMFDRIMEAEGRPDIIHCHFGTIGYLATALKGYDIPFIVTEHSSEMNRIDVNKKLLPYIKKGYHNANTVIAVSKSFAEMIMKNTGVDAIVIGNIVNLEVFCNVQKRDHDTFTFVTTSNLTEIKKISTLIEAFSILYRKRDNIRLHIIGTGELRSELEKLVEKKGIKNSVHFYGGKKRTEIAKIYEKCDCFVMVSRSETFGVAYVEAIAAGIPVIASDCGGPRDFINKGNGLIVNADEVNKVSEAMEYMYCHIKDYDPIKMRCDIASRYSEEIITEKIIEQYRKLMEII